MQLLPMRSGAERSWTRAARALRGDSGRSCARARRGGIGVVLLLVASTLGGCARVAFYEKGQLSDPIMVMEDDPAQVHLYQKVYYSVEGSVGGIGIGAGGGCGCY